MDLLQQLKDNSVYVKGAAAVAIPISLLGIYGIHNLLTRNAENSKRPGRGKECSYLLNDSWREIHQSLTENSQVKENILKNISEMRTKNDTTLNILLLGQAGSGKSSFVNACLTALLQEGRVIKRAAVGAVGSESITERVNSYQLEIKTGGITKHLPVKLFDIRGLFKGNKGVRTEDIKKICEGHIKAGYLIDPKEGIKSDDKKCCQEPPKKGKIHCIVYVLAADEDGFVQDEVLDQFKTIKKICKEDIPQLILLTKIDRLGNNDITQIFRDKRAKESCEQAANFLSLCPNDVFPQSSYNDEVVPCDYKDLITLFNIKTIMERANDWLKIPDLSRDDSLQDEITT
ncbi:uncharacterized protein LOC133194466 [Saccostrea echinata]|uniref:uncharacterized protein LOC133194466 n=1 Tax=Saccostrea echinata TaxID=191078 RepID=UPI002A7FCA82|nr:uncharacterized protein LOC133194466 [Saccostrea echinata]